MCQKLRLLLGNLNDVVEKININNFRDNIVRYLEKKQYRIVDILEHYAVSNHHIVCQSFNDYHIGRPLPQRRQLIAILLLILLWTYTIKYTFLTLHHHDTLITAIGEPLHLVTERPAIIYSILLMAGLTVSIGRSHLFYFEKKHKYVILNLYYYLQRQLPFYKLNQTHNFTLSIKALLLLKFYVQPMIERPILFTGIFHNVFFILCIFSRTPRLLFRTIILELAWSYFVVKGTDQVLFLLDLSLLCPDSLS